MTLAKAQACASAIVGAGFDATIHKINDNNDSTSWEIRATSPSGFLIDYTQVDALVGSQQVSAKMSEVKFS